MATLEEAIGANIRALRGETPMQALGAALAPFLGKPWSRQAVWEAERGRRAFTAAELLALAAALGVTLPQLFESSDPIQMPSGRTLDEVALDALTTGTNDDRERLERLLVSWRGMHKTGQRINALSMVHTAQVARLKAAIIGAPDPATTSSGLPGILDQRVRGAFAADDAWSAHEHAEEHEKP